MVRKLTPPKVNTSWTCPTIPPPAEGRTKAFKQEPTWLSKTCNKESQPAFGRLALGYICREIFHFPVGPVCAEMCSSRSSRLQMTAQGFQEPPLWDCLSQKPRSLKPLTVGHSQKMDVILGVGGDGEIKEKEGSKSGLRLDGRSHRLPKDLCHHGHHISDVLKEN